MFFVTFNEYHAGIYRSQVIDVIKFLNERFKKDIRLVAFIPWSRDGKHKDVKNAIRKDYPKSTILLIYPAKYFGWKYNVLLLGLLTLWYRPKRIIAREIFAAWLGIKLRNIGLISKVCLDGRGPNVAQEEDYKIYPPSVAKELRKIEGMAVNETDFQMSVTEAMVDYWRSYFNYNSDKYVVIPCTLGDSFVFQEIEPAIRQKVRAELGFDENNTVLVFSGSLYGWQSFELMSGFISQVMDKDPNLRMLFLSKEEKNITDLISRYPNRIKRKWLNHEEVPTYLMACDYGILLRNTNMTAKTSVSTKFAEYLASGLGIIVSHNMAITSFVDEKNCGYVVDVDKGIYPSIKPPAPGDKQRMMLLAKEFFYKNSPVNLAGYERMLKSINAI